MHSDFPPTDDYFVYFDPSRPSTFLDAIDQLGKFILSNGPYDGVIAYSHGAQLVVPMLARLLVRHPTSQRFKGATFFSGGTPFDFDVTSNRQHLNHIDPLKTGILLNFPTANIWGQNDQQYPGTSQILSMISRPEWCTEFVHSSGHGIPRPRDQQDVQGCMKAIRRTIGLALVA
ncbi:hypothetical protein QQS21_001447 [Conoideocrella luteorostrata]|uniref:Serine hydrolase domain-containing protein n=1 Tax=Conoideocrella luteorostrata TaxID=1105319 RepID=A0AAJ0G208_9HYPO|nr:hypothetical protein QQS21_001447 [Conoideocrella luteorostrata]